MLLTTWKIGEKRKKLEEEKGIIVRFVIGHRWVFDYLLILGLEKCVRFMPACVGLKFTC